MEIYIKYDKSTYVVTFIHRKPFDPINGLNKTRDELLKTGTFVNEIPTPESIHGKRAIAYYNPETKKIYYKYELAPLSTDERCELLESAVNMALMMK